MNPSRALVFLAGMVAGVALSVATFHWRQSPSAPVHGFPVTANFDQVGALQVGSRVALAGVSIGQVTAIDFDPKYFEARVSMQIEEQYDMIPVDSTASIISQGLFGPQYVSLTPGAAEESLQAGARLEFTQSALIVEQLIGQFLYGQLK